VVVGILAAVGVVLAVATSATAGGSKLEALPASSCGKLQYKGSGSPDVIIASDLPLQGANRALTIEMTKAIAFILDQQGWKAGSRTVGYQSCDDSTAQAGSWDASKCTANANAYGREKSLLGIIGTFNSGCAKLIIPTLNRAPGGPVAMVSPSNTYPGLTVGGPGTAPGEPKVYYPTGKRNYARVVWNDRFQGAADAMFAKQTLHLKSVFVLTDGQTYGLGLATLFRNAASKLGIRVAGFQKWDPNATSYESLASSVQSSKAAGVFLGGIVCLNGGKVIKDLRAALGAKFPIIIPDGFTPFSATGETSGGTSDGAYISYPGIPVKSLKGAGKAFVEGFQKANGGKLPDPYTAYAAQAAQVLLSAIAKSDGTRTSVVSKLVNQKVTGRVLGSFGIDGNGDATLGAVSIGRMKGKDATFLKIITPPVSLAKG